MRKIAALIVVVLLVLSAGCKDVMMREDTAEPPVSDWPVKYDTQVSIGQCVFSKEPESAVLAAIGSALLSSVISQGVNYLGTVLEESAKEKEIGVLASRNVEVNQISFGPCIHLVRGWFYLDPTHSTEKTNESKVWFKEVFINEDKWAKLFQNQLWLAATPDFVFEGRLDVAKSDNTALTVVPQFVQLNDPLFTRKFRSEKERYVSLFFAFADAKDSLALPDKAAASVIVGKLEPGKPIIYPLPKILPRGTINRWPHETDWFTLALPKENKPFTIGGYLQEKQSASEHLKFIAAVFGGAKGEITTALQTSLVPSKKDEAAEANKSAAEKAADGFDDALAAAIIELDKCIAGGDAATASKVRKAMRGLNSAARGINKPEKFTNKVIETIKVTGASIEIKAACNAVRDSIK